MTKTLIKPDENKDFCESQNPKCELRPALLSDPDGAGITPPPLFGWPAGRKIIKILPEVGKGGVISTCSDTRPRASRPAKKIHTRPLGRLAASPGSC